MESGSLHHGLDARLAALATRIAKLRRAMNEATGIEKIERYGEVEELERRYQLLAQRLHGLDREGSGFWRDVKAEIALVADDFTGAVEDFLIWVDAGHLSAPPPKKPPKT